MHRCLIYKWIEQILLYILVPLGLYFFMDELRALTQGMSLVILFLPLIASIMLIILKTKYNVSVKSLLYFNSWKTEWRNMLVMFGTATIIIMGITYLFWPTYLFAFPKENPMLWLLIMVFYPLFSVLPQGIIYRLFFFKRYHALFPNSFLLILASGLYFCFAHIIFHNFIALIFTLIGGFLFAWRYHKSQSLLLSCVEHALYGNLLFTTGLGRYLVTGLQ